MKKRTANPKLYFALATFAAGAGLYPSGDCYAQSNLLRQGPEYEWVARLNVGIGFYDSGWYSCNYFYPYMCSTGAYGSYTPFALGAQVDIPLGGMSYLTPGFQALTGSINSSYFNGTTTVNESAYVTLWAPTLDYVGKFGQPGQETQGRFRLGGVLYFGSDGGFGGALRTGIGGSFLTSHPLGFGLEIVFEGGTYHGYWFSGIQLLASPEFRF